VGEKDFVDPLDGVVALLVMAVDRALVRRDLGVGNVAPAREILFRPQQAVVAVVRLDRLLAEAARGESYFKVYRQFKMYNDPKLNPAVYGENAGEKRGEAGGRKT